MVFRPQPETRLIASILRSLPLAQPPLRQVRSPTLFWSRWTKRHQTRTFRLELGQSRKSPRDLCSYRLFVVSLLAMNQRRGISYDRGIVSQPWKLRLHPSIFYQPRAQHTISNMGMTNMSNTSNPTSAGCQIDIINHIQAIQQNWFIHPATSEPILPPSLLAGVPINCLPVPIIQAIHELSTLTIAQRDRAHNLLNTYFQARIREGSYSGKSQKIFAILEISDVKKACESLRRMSRGREMQGPVPVRIKEDETLARKRKYSIRHEMNAVTEDEEDEGAQRLAKRLKEELCVISEDDNTTSNNEPSTPIHINFDDIPTPPDSQATITATLPSTTTTPQTQRRSRPPPIVISEIPTPTATSPGIVPPFSSFTPLFNSLAREFGGDPDTPCPVRQNTYQPTQPDLLNSYDSGNGNGNGNDNANGTVFESYMRDTYPVPRIDPRVQAAQRATHEFNVRRMEVIEAQRVFEEARRRFGEAKRRMESVRGGGMWR